MKTIVERIGLVWSLDEWIDSEVLVAVSAGADSTALIRLLCELKRSAGRPIEDLQIVHVNHRTRCQSDQDERFVVELAKELTIRSHVIKRDVADAADATFSENSLRQFRYEALVNKANQLGIRYLATGHTADDQIETILFRLARGTGIYGLQGIPELRVQDNVSIVRPLLHVRKAELQKFLNDIRQSYREDQSNSESDYTRNFLRNEVIPALSQKFAGQFGMSLQRIAGQAREHVELLDQLAAPLFCKKSGGFDVRSLAEAHPVIAAHALRAIWRESGLDESGMTAEKWHQLRALVCEGSDAHIQLPGNVTASLRQYLLRFETTRTNRKPTNHRGS